jgi:hypothetical protein
VNNVEVSIKQRFLEINGAIIRAADQVNRKISDIKLVVVTKGQPIEKIQFVIDAGANYLGENYPEETAKKFEQIEDVRSFGIHLHMIGHLQSRKIPLVIKKFDYFHALDSKKLAEKINNQVVQNRFEPLPVLLQFNVSGEYEKFGWNAVDENRWPELCDDYEVLLGLEAIKVNGLMTMPPFVNNPDENRIYFDRLRRLMEFLNNRFSENILTELSMGTSQDFESAIYEGATFLRIGNAIMGQRQ